MYSPTVRVDLSAAVWIASASATDGATGFCSSTCLPGLDGRHRLRPMQVIRRVDDHRVDLVRQSQAEIGHPNRRVDAVHQPHPIQILVHRQVMRRHAAAADK
jgi:hypothetical protein